MRDSSRNEPAGTVHGRAPATMLIFAVSLVLSLLSQTGVLLQNRMLRPGDVSADSLLVSPLLHLAGAHMILTLAAVVALGVILETCWGTTRFVLFYLITSWGTAVVTVLAALALDISGASCGSAGFVLAALAALALEYPDHKLIGSLPPVRYLGWIFIFLTAAGLAALDLHAGRANIFLLPQVAGLAFGIGYVAVLPRVDARLDAARARRTSREEERLRQMRGQVDELLDKINADGFESLTRGEQAFLRQASKRYRRS